MFPFVHIRVLVVVCVRILIINIGLNISSVSICTCSRTCSCMCEYPYHQHRLEHIKCFHSCIYVILFWVCESKPYCVGGGGELLWRKGQNNSYLGRGCEKYSGPPPMIINRTTLEIF